MPLSPLPSGSGATINNVHQALLVVLKVGGVRGSTQFTTLQRQPWPRNRLRRRQCRLLSPKPKRPGRKNLLDKRACEMVDRTVERSVLSQMQK